MVNKAITYSSAADREAVEELVLLDAGRRGFERGNISADGETYEHYKGLLKEYLKKAVVIWSHRELRRGYTDPQQYQK